MKIRTSTKLGYFDIIDFWMGCPTIAQRLPAIHQQNGKTKPATDQQISEQDWKESEQDAER